MEEERWQKREIDERQKQVGKKKLRKEEIREVKGIETGKKKEY